MVSKGSTSGLIHVHKSLAGKKFRVILVPIQPDDPKLNHYTQRPADVRNYEHDIMRKDMEDLKAIVKSQADMIDKLLKLKEPEQKVAEEVKDRFKINPGATHG